MIAQLFIDSLVGLNGFDKSESHAVDCEKIDVAELLRNAKLLVWKSQKTRYVLGDSNMQYLERWTLYGVIGVFDLVGRLSSWH